MLFRSASVVATVKISVEIVTPADPRTCRTVVITAVPWGTHSSGKAFAPSVTAGIITKAFPPSITIAQRIIPNKLR